MRLPWQPLPNKGCDRGSVEDRRLLEYRRTAESPLAPGKDGWREGDIKEGYLEGGSKIRSKAAYN